MKIIKNPETGAVNYMMIFHRFFTFNLRPILKNSIFDKNA